MVLHFNFCKNSGFQTKHVVKSTHVYFCLNSKWKEYLQGYAGYFKTWGTPLGYPSGVPVGVPLKKHRPKQITVKANIRCWSEKKLPKCIKKLQILVSIKTKSYEITVVYSSHTPLVCEFNIFLTSPWFDCFFSYFFMKLYIVWSNN